MNLKKLVSDYGNVSKEIIKLKEENGILSLEEKLEKLQGQIKDIARSVSDEEIDKAQGSGFCVKVSRPFKKIYDLALLHAAASKQEWDIIQDNALKTEVDNEKFEDLVQRGAVSREVKLKAFREEAMTPRVSVLPIKKD